MMLKIVQAPRAEIKTVSTRAELKSVPTVRDVAPAVSDKVVLTTSVTPDSSRFIATRLSLMYSGRELTRAWSVG
jgi:hypothetical protein